MSVLNMIPITGSTASIPVQVLSRPHLDTCRRDVTLMSEAHREATESLNPVAVSRFLSPCKKEFENETERFGNAQRLY